MILLWGMLGTRPAGSQFSVWRTQASFFGGLVDSFVEAGEVHVSSVRLPNPCWPIVRMCCLDVAGITCSRLFSSLIGKVLRTGPLRGGQEKNRARCMAVTQVIVIDYVSSEKQCERSMPGQ